MLKPRPFHAGDNVKPVQKGLEIQANKSASINMMKRLCSAGEFPIQSP